MRPVRWFCTIPLRLRGLFRRAHVERELLEEFQFHLDRQIEEYIAKGFTAEEARYAAMQTFNGMEQRKEECRDTRRINLIEDLIRDVRYSIRGLLKNPGFTCAAVLTLGLGIGGNTAVFTMVNSVLLRQLPFKNAERLVWIWSTRTDRDKAFFSILNFIDTRQRTRTLEDIAAFANWGVNVTGEGDAERLAGVRISANAFQMLGVDAALGRMLLPSDGTPAAPQVVVLSNGLWRRRFGGDPHILGHSLLLNGIPYTIVGVLPAQFVLPNAEVEIASPLIFETDSQRPNRGSNFLRTFALLKPGVTAQQAQAEMSAITEGLRAEYPEENAKHTAPRILPLRDEVTGNYRALLWTLLGAVAIVLVIGCTNLANMLLVRSVARRKDFAIRTALGGTRVRLIREMLTASLLLSLTGGALGVLLARWGVQLLIAAGPADFPRVPEIALDWHVLAFTVCVSVAVGGIFGLTPALQTGGLDVNEELKGSGKNVQDSVRGTRTRSLLVVAEVALSLVLLISAGLLVRSFVKLQAVAPGVDTRNLLSMRMSLPAAKYSQPETMSTFVDRLVDRVRGIPGVRSVSLGSVLPLSGMNTRADFTIMGRPPATQAEVPAAQNRWIAPGYFRTMGVPLIRGREFTELDTGRSQPVVVIDDALARRYWPNENPIGQHLAVSDAGPERREVEIVGVAGNVKHFNLDEPPTATYYSPMTQVPEAALGFLINGLSLVVRTDTDPLPLADPVRRQIQALDKDVAASSVLTMDQLLATSVAPRRFNLLLIEIFAAAALVLAVMGMYSVIAYSVTERKREIGIRIALGASATAVLKQVLSEGIVLALFGEAAGIAAAFSVTRFMSDLLYGVTPTDPFTFASVALLLISTTLIACYIPARRATRVDPVQALRAE